LRKTSSFYAWLQLLRLPNVFTAVADVLMGFLVTHRELQPLEHMAALMAASSFLYLGGIVLNDVFDAPIDARHRLGRPIPSGRISRKVAAVAGAAMLAIGVLVAWILSFAANDWRPGAVATLLAACIVLYDGALKRTWAAPLLMGECRTLNVLLGMSLLIIPWGKPERLIAIGIGIYIVGVTVFARTDAFTSSRVRLSAGLFVLVAGMALLAAVPQLTLDRPHLNISLTGWYFLWAALALIIARRCAMAVVDPSPERVQRAVRHCVHSIIALDAAVCVGYASPYWGFVVLSLLFPTLLLTMWLDAT
jgi:4-hydroxybenzoate polyprenyltransferase